MYSITKAKIVSRTADKSCTCGSRLQHWENFSDNKAILCFEGQLVGLSTSFLSACIIINQNGQSKYPTIVSWFLQILKRHVRWRDE